MNEGKQMTTAVIRSDVSDKMMESEIFQGSSEINCTTRQETQLIGPLTVQADELQFILNQLQCTINYHEEVIQTKFPALERSISSLHSELNRSFVRHESEKMIQTMKQDVCFAEKEGVSNTPDESAFHTIRSIHHGRQRAVLEAQKDADRSMPSTLEELHALRRETVGLRSLVQQLQIEHDNDIIGSAEKANQLELIRKDLVELHKKAVASVSAIQVSDLHQSIRKNRTDIKNISEDLENKFTCQIRDIAQKCQDDVKFWCEHYDVKASQRNEKLRSQFATFVKSCDFQAYCDICELDAKHYKMKHDQTVSLLQSTIIVIAELKKAFSVQKLSRMIYERKLRLLRRAAAIWKRMVISWNQNVALSKVRDKLSLSILRRHQRRYLRNALRQWNLFMKQQQKLEQAIAQAITTLVRKVKHYTRKNKDRAFKKWHFVSVSSNLESSTLSDGHECSKNSPGSIRTMIRPFGNDERGAILMLACEMESIKNKDLPNLERIFREEQTQCMLNAHQSLIDTESRLSEAAAKIERQMVDQIESVNMEFPPINRKLDDQESLLMMVVDRLNQMEDRYEKNLKILLDYKESSSDRIYELEVGLKRACSNITALVRDLEKANSHLKLMSEKLIENDRHQSVKESEFHEKINHLDTHIEAANIAILENSAHCVQLNHDLEGTRYFLKNFEAESRSQFDSVNESLKAPGVQRPSLDLLVRDCMMYENLAQEKRYVVDVVHASDSGKNINFSITICALAHDFAEWIAYKADQEGILQVVAGRNLDEMTYADDKISMRRRSLLEDLKTELEISLEDAHTKPGALRLEARTKFVTRFIEATDTALSKYDQVVVSMPSRMGRRSTNVATCIGCDRPLVNRGRRSTLPETDDTEKVNTSERDSNIGQGNNKGFVMRAGFKMPSSSNLRPRPSKISSDTDYDRECTDQFVPAHRNSNRNGQCS